MSDNSKFKRKRGANEDTLLFLLRSLHGKRVVVELDSNIELNGLLTGVDENMTCTLTDVYRRNMYFSSNIIKEDDTTVLGKHIRYVHLPDSLDVMGAMEKHISTISSATNQYKRGVRKPAPRPQPSRLILLEDGSSILQELDPSVPDNSNAAQPNDRISHQSTGDSVAPAGTSSHVHHQQYSSPPEMINMDVLLAGLSQLPRT